MKHTPKRKPIGYFEKFQSHVANWVKPIASTAYRTGVHISGPDKRRYEVIFDGFVEITNSLEALRLRLKFTQTSPPRVKGVSRDQYLKYHINAHLQECYIFQQRLLSYAKKLARLYRNVEQADKIKVAMEALGKSVVDSMAGVVSVRGRHVHQERYYDTDLVSLSSLTLVLEHGRSSAEDLKNFRWAQTHYFTKNRDIWVKRMKHNIEQLEGLLEVFFRVVCAAFAPDGKLDPP